MCWCILKMWFLNASLIPLKTVFFNFRTRTLFALQHRALYIWYYISSGSCQITISALALPCSWYGVLSAIYERAVAKKVDVSLCSQVGLQGSEIPRWCLYALIITPGIIRWNTEDAGVSVASSLLSALLIFVTANLHPVRRWYVCVTATWHR